MQIPLNWINELVNIEITKLDDLIEKLILGGFEVEKILEIEINNRKQKILDISATTNRSDSLSIQGLSIEIAALLNNSINFSMYSVKSENFKKTILKNVTNLVLDKNCTSFVSLSIENIMNRTVPKWITDKLISSGIMPLNNLIDFQNYILLETGYPFAFYDLDKINSTLNNSDFNLLISNANHNFKFLATNGITYTLDNSILLIKANETPISIAGIIETQKFSYSNSTTSLLIEGSTFKAAKIRQQSRNLGLRTERSTRYEKSLKNTYLIESLYRLILLLRIANPNVTCKFKTIMKKSNKISKPILLHYKTICELLGPNKELPNGKFEYLNIKTIENYLNRLKFITIFDKSKQIWEVTIPDFRIEDITREIDLIEEIGRLHGFNNFLINLPKLKMIGIEDANYKTRKKITSCLLNLGFNELIHYSLVSQKTFIDNELKLINPLVSEYSNLRKSLLPNLIKTAQENLKQSNSVINGFEYGHGFLPDSALKFREKEYIAGIFGNLKTKLNWSDSEREINWFEAKGKIEQLFKQLNISPNWQNLSEDSINNLLHPYRNTTLYFTNNIKLGVFGQIHPILANKLNFSSEIYLFEFDVKVIQNQMQMNPLVIYKEYFSYPKIVKDISFIIKRNISFNEVKKVIYYNGTKFLSEINILDKYTGQSIPDQYISLCFQLIFNTLVKNLVKF